MVGGPSDQQAYDRGTSIFSPNGRIYQVEYAREAVEQGSPVVGVTDDTGLVLAATVSTRSPLVETESVEKLYTIDDHLVVGGSGHAADTRRLVDLARRTAQEERIRYEEPITADALATAIADHLHDHTQTGGARPYGSALLVAGHGDTPRLLEVDPSGSTRAWRANAIGSGSQEIVDHLEGAYEREDTSGDALALALASLRDTVADVEPTAVTAARVDADGYRFLPTDEIESVFEQNT